MEQRLADRVAIITGGGGGIGRATALRMAAEGAVVVVSDVDAERGEPVAKEVRDAGGRAEFRRTDVSSAAEVDALTTECAARFGRLDVMFNNAGIAVGGRMLDLSPEAYRRVIAVNQEGVLYGIQAAARAMRACGRGGVIVNTGSIYAQLASRGAIGYQATKAAVEIMTKVAALELASSGIRVVSVAPGVVDTPMIQGYRDAGVVDEMARRHMRGALVDPDKVARVVTFLASDAADGINGTTVFVDDGYSAFK